MKYIKLCDPVSGAGCAQHGAACPSPGKVPMSSQWQMSGEDERPEGNAGVLAGPEPSGSGVLIVDIDAPELMAIVATWDLPATYTVRTGRADGSGVHMYFRWPAGITRVPARLDGVELKGPGRQVVAPGSMHLSGRRYEVERDLPLADLPESIIARIAAAANQSGTRNNAEVATIEAEEALERLLERFPDAVEQTDGNYVACCPAHDDTNPSLVLTASGNRVLAYCRSGCSVIDIVRAVGLDINALYGAKTNVLGEEDDAGTSGRSRTDMGNAERLVDRFGRRLRYVDPWKAWLSWDGCRWVRDRNGTAIEAAKKTVQGIIDEAAEEVDDDEAAALRKWYAASQNVSRLKAMVELAKSDPRVGVSPDQLDADRWLLNCENGTLNLKTGELQPHDPDNLITRCLPAPYLPSATAPKWHAFLERVQPSAEVRAYIQRVCGMALTGSNPERVMFVFHGDGRNGKSVIAEAMQDLLGDYAGPISKDALIERRSGQVRNDLADARGRRLVVTSETEDGERLSVAEVKAITGGDSISVRRLYENQFSFRPEFKVWLLTNYLPRVTDPGVATWDRLRVIPFGVRIPDDDVIPLEDMLAGFRGEAAGILSWVVQGCAEWRRIGLAEPVDVVLAAAQWRESEDVIGQFLSETTSHAPGLFINGGDLYRAYKAWCVENGHQAWSQKRWSPSLQKRGMEKCVRDRARGYCGRVFTDDGRRLAGPAISWSER